ncbi:MAG TPA: carbamoyl-phosphate synthase large subunit, partial [Limnochordia bacterium]|nr:carbamoyl-phosphate synthase large subunit [Limnochordia bacterium]
LRSAALKIIRALKIEGGCNVQFALDPESYAYKVIEVNPRVSRSSALASKATGYPIAKVASKIAIGYTLDEIQNPITKKTTACFEPAIDYIVTKIPRWPFDKFGSANRRLGTQMKATGEVMAIGRTFETSLQKAVRSLEIGVDELWLDGAEQIPDETLRERLAKADDERLFLLAEAYRRGFTTAELHGITMIDEWFLEKIEGLIAFERELKAAADGDEAARWRALLGEAPEPGLLERAKRLGFADTAIQRITGIPAAELARERQRLGLKPVYKMVDTCAAEFPAATPYYYGAWEREDEVIESVAPAGRKIMVLGSGPIRIGQGIEFDYCSVHAALAIRAEGLTSLIVNNNPETVSTDFDTADRLFFEPLYAEDVLHVVEREKPEGVVVQFGGQTAINLAEPLANAGVKIMGTPLASIDASEDREKFDALLETLGIPRPAGKTVTRADQAVPAAQTLGYPIVVRPSYVLGGRAMEIVYNDAELSDYMTRAVKVSPRHPVLMDRYLLGREIEVDAICDGETVVIPGVMEHIERAGVHSGDSIAVYPTQSLTAEEKQTVVDYTTRIALELGVIGLVNIQYVLYKGKIYVLEVNPRSSRTVPFLSKVTGVPMVPAAMRAILGTSLKAQGYESGLWPEPSDVAVKVPVFSFNKLRSVDVALGPEMKSTGEVIGRAGTLAKALAKGLIAAGMFLPEHGWVLATVAGPDKQEALPIVAGLYEMGFHIAATEGTAAFLRANGIDAQPLRKLREGSPHVVDFIQSGKCVLVINTLERARKVQSDGFRIRREAVEHNIPCLTSLDTARALYEALATVRMHVQPLTAPGRAQEK